MGRGSVLIVPFLFLFGGRPARGHKRNVWAVRKRVRELSELLSERLESAGAGFSLRLKL